MSIEKHWKQINNLIRFAIENGLTRDEDNGEAGLPLAKITRDTITKLEVMLLPPQAQNPIDLGGRRQPETVDITTSVAQLGIEKFHAESERNTADLVGGGAFIHDDLSRQPKCRLAEEHARSASPIRDAVRPKARDEATGHKNSWLRRSKGARSAIAMPWSFPVGTNFS